ncbi:hypothetical protein [Burkholderia vietnamiensis]|uniref:hypothetical protein n=1 Tax=Burkholderia vietnamiensis TaxID=60552 RepID=UPI001D1558AF|nr:hypothetical protein [Burkholderia vietnamiensis]UEC01661.1 hypothetical protein LK462_06445 [Burkholderia vietnamiensis]
METQTTVPLVPLYHGTRAASARSILHDGFRRSASRSYTGTGICLSESITVAYEYGMYETGGCVLEARLASSACWTDKIDGEGDRCTVGEAWDRLFVRKHLDAVRSFGGNVWVVWNPAALVSVRRLSHREAIRRLCAAFDEDGPDCGYNGVASEYASIWWGREAQDPNLMRFPEEEKTLRQNLQRFVGRCRSALVAASCVPRAGV